MPKSTGNDGLIVLRLAVDGIEQANKGAAAVERYAAAAKSIKPVKAEIQFNLVSSITPALDTSTREFIQWGRIVREQVDSINAALRQMRAELARLHGLKISSSYESAAVPLAPGLGLAVSDLTAVARAQKLLRSAMELNRNLPLIGAAAGGAAIDAEEAVKSGLTGYNKNAPRVLIGARPIATAAEPAFIQDVLRKNAAAIMLAEIGTMYTAAIKSSWSGAGASPFEEGYRFAGFSGKPGDIPLLISHLMTANRMPYRIAARAHEEFGAGFPELRGLLPTGATSAGFEQGLYTNDIASNYEPESRTRASIRRLAAWYRKQPWSSTRGSLTLPGAGELFGTGPEVGSYSSFGQIPTMAEMYFANRQNAFYTGRNASRNFGPYWPPNDQYGGNVGLGLGGERLGPTGAGGVWLRSSQYPMALYTGGGGGRGIGGGPPPGLAGSPLGGGGGGLYGTAADWNKDNLRGGGLFGTIGNRIGSLAQYAVAAAVIYPIAASVHDAFHSAVELEVILKRIQGIYGNHTLSEQLTIKDEIVSTARKFGENLNQVAEAAQQFAQEQIPFADLGADLNAAAAGAKAFGTNISTVADFIIAVKNSTQGRVGGQQAVDIVQATVARGAVSAQNVISFIQSITPLLETFSPSKGLINDEAFGAALIQTGARTARLTGTQLRTTLQSLLGKFGTPSAITKIEQQSGVQLGTVESGGEELRPLIEILNSLSDAYTKLIKAGQGARADELLRTLFGPRQIVAGAALLKSFNQTLQAAVDITNDHGAASRAAALQLDSYQTSVTNLKTSFELLAKSLLDNAKPALSTIANLFSTVFTEVRSDIDFYSQWIKDHPEFKTGLGVAAGLVPGAGLFVSGPSAPTNVNADIPGIITGGILNLVKNPPVTLSQVKAGLQEKGVPLVTGSAGRGGGSFDWSTVRTELTEIQKLEDIQRNYRNRVSALDRAGIRKSGKYDQTTPEEVYNAEIANITAKKREDEEGAAIALNRQLQVLSDIDFKQKGAQKFYKDQVTKELEVYHVELARIDADYNYSILQAKQTEELSKQLEIYKQIKAVSDAITKGIETGLLNLPKVLAAQRGGLGGTARGVRPLTALWEALGVPFGAALYGATTRNFGRSFQGIGDWFAHRIVGGQSDAGISSGGPSFQIYPGGVPSVAGAATAGGWPIFGGGPSSGEPAFRIPSSTLSNTSKIFRPTKTRTEAQQQRDQALLAIGVVAGTTLGSAYGGSTTGAEIGSTLGAIGGNALFPGVGGLVGGALGGFLGGFIGPKPKAPPLTGDLKIIADNSREQVRLLENTNKLLAANFVSFNVPTGFRLPAYQPSLFGGVGLSRGAGGGGVNNTDINVQVNIGGTNLSAEKIGNAVAQAVSDRLDLEARSAGVYNPRLTYS